MLDHSQATAADQSGTSPPASPRRPRRPALSCGWHWLAAVLLAAGLVLRVLAELAYRPALFYIDTPRYLFNADGMDPVGYKGPLRAILAVANFDTVTAVQHLLGLAMAVVIYVLLRRRGVSRWLAALAMAPVLLDGYQLQIRAVDHARHLVRGPDRGRPGHPALAAGHRLAAAAGGRRAARRLGHRRPGRRGPAAARRALRAGRLRDGWRQRIAKAAAVCAAFALPILAYMAGSYLLGGAFALSHTGVTSLYGRMAAAADCADAQAARGRARPVPVPGPAGRGARLARVQPGLPGPAVLQRPRRGPQTDAQLSDFNHQVLTQQPLRVLRAYGRDVLKLYAVTRTTSPGDTPIWRWQFQTYYPYYPPHAAAAQVRAWIDRSAAARPPSGPRWPPSCAPTSSTAATRPARCWPLFTVTGLAGSLALLRRRASGPGRVPPDRAGLPAVLRLRRGAAAGVGPVRVLLALPAARAGHPGARRGARAQRPVPAPSRASVSRL